MGSPLTINLLNTDGKKSTRDDILELNKFTEYHYEASADFYRKKRIAFLSHYLRRSKNNQTGLKKLTKLFEKAFVKQINANWIKIQKKLIDPNNGYLTINSDGSFIINTSANNFDNVFQKNISFSRLKDASDKEQTIWMALGKEVEHYTFGVMRNRAKTVANSALSLIFKEAELTGDRHSKTALRQRAPNIRADIGWNIQREASKGGVLFERNSNQNIPIELQKIIEFEMTLGDDNKATYSESDPLITTYLKSSISGGMSLKLWNYRNRSNKEYTQASKLKEHINKDFRNVKRSWRTTWNKTYAQAYANYMVAKNLISIIGPGNFALSAGSEFVWMDKFLENTLLYMNITLKSGTSEKDGSSGPDTEIFPEIKDGSVYLRALKNRIHALSSARNLSNKKSGNETHDDVLRFYMKRKSIK